jgi:hypothetical protein
MNFEEGLVYELQSISGLEGKVFPLNATEGTNPPFVIYVSSEGEQLKSLDGTIEDLSDVTCEIHVVAETYEKLKSLLKAVIDKLQSFFGRPIGVDGVSIKSFSMTEPIEGSDEELDYKRSSFEIRVRY